MVDLGDSAPLRARANSCSGATRRERTPQEEQEWLEDKRAEYEADAICGHAWSNI